MRLSQVAGPCCCITSKNKGCYNPPLGYSGSVIDLRYDQRDKDENNYMKQKKEERDQSEKKKE
jgi:hypothetical protein